MLTSKIFYLQALSMILELSVILTNLFSNRDNTIQRRERNKILGAEGKHNYGTINNNIL